MGAIDDFINNLLGGQASPIAATNDAERDGNINDLLFRFEQPALGLNVAGGTTLTNISPTTAASDLSQGRISLAVLVWLAVAGFVAWWLFKKA